SNNIAFNQFNMTLLHWEVVSENIKVLSFHNKYGARETGIRHSAYIIAGSPVDMITFELTRDEWPQAEKILTKYAVLAERWLQTMSVPA
ncbi:MAG: GNAT family N-acetyltransferase, partial [Chloroflexi bacterium]|nr:GNAT family N-acetyltransferase [Chloroflexota bacterium]